MAFIVFYIVYCIVL